MHNVYFLGPENTYSFLIATVVFLTPEYMLVAVKSFDEVFDNTKNNGIGILPIENSSTSDVHSHIDTLFEKDFSIIGEGYLKISLCLIANQHAELKEITDVYSHSKALEQTSTYIKTHAFTTHQTLSTGEGKKIVEKSVHAALIGSRQLGEEKGLKILDTDIGNVLHNMTRFVFVTKENMSLSKTKSKASVIFTVHHIPGALAKVLTSIADNNINVTKIQSRPIPGSDWEYSFWIDIEKEDVTKHEIEKVFTGVTNSHTIVGIYEKGRTYDSD